VEFKLGIIGLGVISKFYLDAIGYLENVKLIAVCDINIKKLEKFSEQGIDCYKDYKLLFQRTDLDGVIINAPNDKHYEICKHALELGINVCCEKPLTTKIDDARELSLIAKKKKTTLFTAFHRRYNENFLAGLKKINFIKDITKVKASYLEDIKEHAGNDSWYLEPKKCGGGCVVDNGPNVFDTLSFFLGELHVTDVEVIRNNQDIDLQAFVKLKNNEGIPIEVELDWEYKFGEKKDVEIFTKDGKCIFIDMLNNFTIFKSSLYHEYREIIKDFCQIINEGAQYGEAGLDAVRLVNSVYSMEKLNASKEGIK